MQKSILVDDRQEQYTTFFQDDFAKQAIAASRHHSGLRQLTFDFVAELRGISYAAALPVLVPSSIKEFHDSFANAEPSSTGILKYSKAILTRLAREIPELLISSELNHKLQIELVRISNEITEIDSRVKTELDGELLWRHYLSQGPFHLGLHSTLRQCYLNIYGAFENFVVRCVSIADGKSPMRASDNDFKKSLRRHFGEIADGCWYSTDLNAARLVRHSLIHAGGRITNDLMKIKIPIIVHEEHLHVFPEHLRSLYAVVSAAALKFVRAPVFQAITNKSCEAPD
jgi:hypothetical protein